MVVLGGGAVSYERGTTVGRVMCTLLEQLTLAGVRFDFASITLRPHCK